MVFLLDASQSIWIHDFRKQIMFVQDVVNLFDINANTVRVGVATYSDVVHLQMGLDDYHNKSQLLLAIDKIQHNPGDATNTGHAIKYMMKHMFKKREGGRPHVVRVGIVITDGQSGRLLDTIYQASKARRIGHINMFAIGIGSATNYRELRGIASKPESKHLFNVNTYSNLDAIKEVLAKKTCEGLLLKKCSKYSDLC